MSSYGNDRISTTTAFSLKNRVIVLTVLLIFNILLLTVVHFNVDRRQCSDHSERLRQHLRLLANPYRNLTAYGQFYVRDHDGQVLQKCPSVWLQDDENAKLKIAVGIIGTSDWVGEYFFFKQGSYVISPLKDVDNRISAVCTYIKNWNYTEELSKYERQLLYDGRRLWKSNDAPSGIAHLFTGIINKTNRAEVVQRLVDDKSMLPVLLRRIPLLKASYAYTEFIYDTDKMTTDPPASERFCLPSICNTATTVDVGEE